MIGLNTQPVEKQVLDNDGALDVQEIWKTIQGEGPYAGVPAVFIRLAGCNLNCPYCDTDYTSSRTKKPASQIVNNVKSLFGEKRVFQSPLVVITGGEPFRQNIGPLVQDLTHAGCLVQIETNGTLFVDPFPYASQYVKIVCSPKTPKIAHQLEPWIDCYKYVLQAGHVDKEDGLPTTALGGVRPARPPGWINKELVFLQPMDSQNEKENQANLEATVKSCMEYGWRFGMQLHKLIGVA